VRVITTLLLVLSLTVGVPFGYAFPSGASTGHRSSVLYDVAVDAIGASRLAPEPTRVRDRTRTRHAIGSAPLHVGTLTDHRNLPTLDPLREVIQGRTDVRSFLGVSSSPVRGPPPAA
jgi:hypothetical protein